MIIQKNKKTMSKKIKKEERKKQEEIIWNVPNALTIIRIFLSIVLILIAIKGYDFLSIGIILIVAGLTDFFDGQIARRCNQITNFGRKWDPIADRILLISAFIALVVSLSLHNQLTNLRLFAIVLLITREILASPIFIVSLFIENSRRYPHARFIAKTTTLLQGVTLPMLILSFPIYIYFPLAIITSILGIICAGYYIYDCILKPNNDFQIKNDGFYKKLS